MAQHKPTSDPKQAWTFLGLLLLVSAIFGYAVLPYFDPGKSRLVGSMAPSFTLGVVNGGENTNRINLDDLRGNVVVLDFWASWCAPCRAQAPIIDRVARAHLDRPVRILGVNTSDHEESARQFWQTNGLRYASVLDLTGDVARAFNAYELPTLVVIDAAGFITFAGARVISEPELTELIAEALEHKSER
jgi:thiol-disulfide isomerase/thioredoxin